MWKHKTIPIKDFNKTQTVEQKSDEIRQTESLPKALEARVELLERKVMELKMEKTSQKEKKVD